MQKFDGVLICTDLDGTLLCNDKSISKENVEAIEYFKANGGFFTFVTGRMPFYVQNIYNVIQPNAPFGCVNGGGAYDHRTKKYVWKQELSRSVLELVEYVYERLDIGFQVCTFENTYFCRENSAMRNFRKHTGVPHLTCHYTDVKEPIAKILFGDNDENKIAKLKELLDSHPRANEFGFIRSEKALYEIIPKGKDKGTLLTQIAEHLGIDMNKTIAVGDYNNDVPMIKAAKIGVAVSNACEAARLAADYITVSNNEHAIAKIISDLESGILKI